MIKKDYSTKEIIFGLREENKRVERKLDKVKSLLTYDDKTFTIIPSIREENKLYLESALKSKDLGFLKVIKYMLTTKFIKEAIVVKVNEHDYEIVFKDEKNGTITFPAHINNENKEEFNNLINMILSQTSIPMLVDKDCYRLDSMSYTPSTIEVDSAVGNIYPYKVIYMTNSDTIRFSSKFEEMTPRIIERILDSSYDSEILTETAKKIIDESEAAKKSISILNYNKLTESEEYGIEELPNRLVLMQKRSK